MGFTVPQTDGFICSKEESAIRSRREGGVRLWFSIGRKMPININQIVYSNSTNSNNFNRYSTNSRIGSTYRSLSCPSITNQGPIYPARDQIRLQHLFSDWFGHTPALFNLPILFLREPTPHVVVYRIRQWPRIRRWSRSDAFLLPLYTQM